MMRNKWLVMGLAIVIGACGGGDDGVTDTDTDDPAIDATPPIDAAPPDAVLTDKAIGDLTADELIALCEVAVDDPDIGVGLGDRACIGEDCKLSATAVEDCAAKTPDQAFDCANIELGANECQEPASELVACLGGFFGQFAAYAEPTCATVGELPPFADDPAAIAECETLVAECPEIF